MGKLTAKYRYRVVKQSDQRIRIVNEIIQGIQTIKMYAWEIPFLKSIQQIRRCVFAYGRLKPAILFFDYNFF